MSSAMNVRTGCWTCRLRRKKCDGRHPGCSKCESLKITCYGYGSKPEWIDGGSKEREKAQEIRGLVKITWDSLRRPRALLARQRRQTPIEPKLTERSYVPSEEVYLENRPEHEGPSLYWGGDPEMQLTLFDHYVNEVFPIHVPFYNPPTSDESGTFWLRSFLKNNRTLYTAALSISAYHIYLISISNDGSQVYPLENEESDRLYAEAIAGLRCHVTELSQKNGLDGLKDGLDVLACLTLMVFLDVLKGGTGSWHTHLRGAPTLFPFLQTYCGAVPQQPGDSTVFHPCAGNTIQSPSLPTSLDTSAMEFFSAAILYLDILACASTGMPPQYPHICADALSDGNSVIQLDQIIGCENWVMLIIRDIGVLDGWKKTRIAQNFPYIEELGIRANAIEHRLYDGIQRSISVLSQFGPSTASQELLSGGVDFKNINIHIVTHLYALSTRVYLHVIIHGPDCGSLPLQERVAQSIAAFHNLPDPKLLRSLVWPFCITGCMATSDEQQQFLTDICHSVTTNGGGVGTLKSALDVMEKCWEMRKEEGIKSQDCDWLRAMERLGNKVLLV